MFFLLLSALLDEFSSKLMTGIVQLGGTKDDHRWKYVSKFGYNVGVGSYAVRVKTTRPVLTEPVSIPFNVFLDNDWDMVDNSPDCAVNEQGKLNDLNSKDKLSKTTRYLTIPLNGTWSG
jgi:hypothetical protein